MQLVRAALDPLTLADRARLHELPGGRLAVSWRGDAASLLRQTLDGIEALLADAPLDSPGIPELIGMFALPAEGAALLREARAGVVPERRDVAPLTKAAAPDPALLPLDAAALELAEQLLAAADVTRFARRRPVCRLGRSGMQHAWDDRFLSVPELIDAVAPDRTAHGGDPWLFRRLTRVLDRRMLALLGHPDELRGAGPFSLTLNVGSLLSPEFLRFDAALTPGLRGRVVIDVLPPDILADPAAFAFARNFARARSYRIGLGPVSAALLPFLTLSALELDFVRLRWSAKLAKFGRELPDPGAARWILTDADHPAALDWGREAGIGLFQGQAVSP
jgi:hypothetical protein